MKKGLKYITLAVCLFLFPLSAMGQMGLSISGLELDKSDKEGHFEVIQVYPASPAHRAGIKEGDLLFEVDHTDISEMDSNEVENLLASRSGSGRSSVLTLKRDGSKIIAWIKAGEPYLSQRRILDFYQKIDLLGSQSDSLWKNMTEKFRQWTASENLEEEYKKELDLAGQEFLRLKLEIASLELPTGIDETARAQCVDLRHAYTVLQNARNNVRWKMTDYASTRWDDRSYLQERWDRMVASMKEAEKKERNARYMGMKLLRSGNDNGEDLAELLGK